MDALNGSIGNTYPQNPSMKRPSCIVNLGKGATYTLLNKPVRMQDWAADLELETYSIWPVSMGNKLSPQEVVPVDSSTNRTDSASSKYWSERYPTNTSYMGVPNPLAVFGHVALRIIDDNTSLPLNISVKNASRCLITLCETQDHVRVEGGATHKEVISTNYGHLFPHPQDSGDLMTCWQPEPGPVDLVHDEGEYHLDINRRAFCPVDGYGSYMIRALQSNATISSTFFKFDEDPSSRDSVRMKDSDSDNVGLLATKTLKSKAEGIAASLTHYGLQRSNTTVIGRAFTNERYVHVRWVWMILAASLEVATLVLFIATIVQSHRAGLPTWKSSVLAVYYHDEGSKDTGMPLERVSDMDKAAGSTTVRLVMNPRVGHVLGRDSTDHQASAD